jgi:hypothetical protein
LLRDEENDGAPPRTDVDLDAGTVIVRRPPGLAIAQTTSCETSSKSAKIK